MGFSALSEGGGELAYLKKLKTLFFVLSGTILVNRRASTKEYTANALTDEKAVI